jgi:predicted enzyme related to lactoylglutathione lyase
MLGEHVVAAWRDPAGLVGWSSLDGDAWSPPATVPGARAEGAPSLVSTREGIRCAWEAPGGGIAWASFDGRSWSAPRAIRASSMGREPALASVDDVVYALWRGPERDRSLWWSRFEGQDWSEPLRVPRAAASSGPSAAAVDHRLAIAWTGVGLDRDVRWATFDGRWSPPARTGLTTCERPSLVAHRGYLVVATRGREASRCEDPSDYGGSWDVSSIYVVDLPRSSTDVADTQGRMVWRSLRTTDARAAVAFYREVIGWEVKYGDEFWTLSSVRGPLGGISQISQDDIKKGVAPHWVPAVAVADVDAAAKKVLEADGKVFVGPKLGSNGIRFAVVGDPSGSVIDLLPISPGAALHDSTELGDFFRVLLTTGDDGAKVQSFLERVFDWQVLTVRASDPAWLPGRYVTMAREGTEVASVRFVPGEERSWWLFHVEVPDLDAAVARATEAGGSVWFGPAQMPDGGRIVELVDPQGARFGLHEAARRTSADSP